MRVLITGVGGFVGLRLARHLLDSGDQVSGTYINSAPVIAGVDLREAPLQDRTALEGAVEAADPDVIVHLAGLAQISGSWHEDKMPDYFWVNLVGTENLLAAAAGRKVVIASSADVYGRVPETEQPIRESQAVSPRSPYGLTKAAAERLAFAYGNAVVARSFNMIGPGQSLGFVLADFAKQLAGIAREGDPVMRVGNLSPRRDFLHVDDGAAAYRLLAAKGEPGTAYNIASGQAVSIEEILHRLMGVAGVSARVEIDPQKLRKVDLPLLQGDSRRLRALGWQPERSLDDALSDLWAEAIGAARVRAAE